MNAPLVFAGTTLRTERLILEPLQAAHAAPMFEGFADPALYTWLDVTPPRNVDDLGERFARIAKPYAPTGDLWLNWPVRLGGDGSYVGLIEATMRQDRVAFLAYFVFLRYARRGFGKEACAAVIEHLWRAYDAVEIRAEMDYRNIPSRCLVEALGFLRRTHNKVTTLRGRPSVDYRYRLKRPEG